MTSRVAVSVLVASLAASCASPRAPVPTTPVLPSPKLERDGLLLRMSRDGMCFGWCPGYSVEVGVSGRVTYEGRDNVLTAGRATARLAPEALAALRRAVDDARLNTLSDDCCRCPGPTDYDSVTLTVADGATPKTIYDYQGCKAPPEGLRALEDAIDRIVGTETWIGSDEDRRACFEWGASKEPCALGVRALGPNHCSVLRGVFTQASNDMMPPAPWPGTLVSDAGSVGFLVSTVLPGSPYALCGFENGDVWTAVNGIPLTSTDAAAKAYNLIGAAPSLAVALLRRGQPMSIRVDLR